MRAFVGHKCNWNQLFVFINSTVCLTPHSWDQKFKLKDPTLTSILDNYPEKDDQKLNYDIIYDQQFGSTKLLFYDKWCQTVNDV